MGYVHVGGRGVAAPPAGSGGAPGSAHYAFNGSPFCAEAVMGLPFVLEL